MGSNLHLKDLQIYYMIKIETKGSFFKIVEHWITNLLGFIRFYKFYVKSSFHRFEPKSHEFHVMVNINDICTYSIQTNETLFLNDTHECSCLIHKNHIALCKITSQ